MRAVFKHGSLNGVNSKIGGASSIVSPTQNKDRYPCPITELEKGSGRISGRMNVRCSSGRMGTGSKRLEVSMYTVSPLRALTVVAEGLHVTVASLEFSGVIHLPEPSAAIVGWAAIISCISLLARCVPPTCAILARLSRATGNFLGNCFELIGKIPAVIGGFLVASRRKFGRALGKMAAYFQS